MPFKYQLQKALDLREREEKRVDAEVLDAQRKLKAEQDRLAEIDMRKAAAQKGLNAQMAAGATGDVAASNDYIQSLSLRIEQQQKLVSAANAVLNEVKSRQAEVRQARQKLEKHREMKLVEWQAEQKKKDAKRIDEMAGTIFMKKRMLAEEAGIEELERFEKLAKLQALRALREGR